MPLAAVGSCLECDRSAVHGAQTETIERVIFQESCLTRDVDGRKGIQFMSPHLGMVA